MSGCSTRLLYPNLDWIIPFYIDDYISLDNEQDNQLDNELISLLGWHCQTQLPAYSGTLRILALELEATPGSLTTEQIGSYAKRFEEHWDMLLGRLLPQGAELLGSASDSQVTELIENLEQGNVKFREKYVEIEPDEVQQTRTSDMVDTLERWVDPLTREQKQRIEEWSLQMEDIGKERLKHRMLLVDEFSKIVVDRNSSATYQQDLVALLVDLDVTRSPEYIEMLQNNRTRTHRLLVDLYVTLDQEQHQQLTKNILSLAKDFDALACQTVEQTQPVVDD